MTGELNAAGALARHDRTVRQHAADFPCIPCLLKRMFDIDIERCPRCGARLKIIAAIVDPQVIVQILTRLGLPARAPTRSAADAGLDRERSTVRARDG